MFIEGPDLFSNGSPTVSPDDGRLVCVRALDAVSPSKYFVALSHAPPAIAIEEAIRAGSLTFVVDDAPRAGFARMRAVAVIRRSTVGQAQIGET